jgi:hypothetical protein
MWFSYAAIAFATDLTRGVFGTSIAASFRIACCEVARLQRLPMAFSVQFAVTPDRTGSLRVVLPLLSSGEQEAEHEAPTAVDLDSTNFLPTTL